jgi:hypothetical protein
MIVLLVVCSDNRELLILDFGSRGEQINLSPCFPYPLPANTSSSETTLPSSATRGVIPV